MLLLLVFSIVVDIIVECARQGLMNIILYADDLFLMSSSTECLREKFSNFRVHLITRV